MRQRCTGELGGKRAAVDRATAAVLPDPEPRGAARETTVAETADDINIAIHLRPPQTIETIETGAIERT